MKRTEAQTEAFLQARAEEMRRWPTAAERAARDAFGPLGFKAQFVMRAPRLKHPERVDLFILDFFNEGAKLCVEIDGGYHRGRSGPDRRRDSRLAQMGIATLRFDNSVVEKDLEGVVAIVRTTLESAR
jgi:very-short-patch-repair endonuclease